MTTTRRIYRIVPAGTRNVYAAGYDGNRFDTIEETEAAIDSLRALGGDFDIDWDWIEEGDAAAAEARAVFVAYCREIGSDEVAEENAILSVGREFLPPCAIAVLDGADGTAEYFEWLHAQTHEAQQQHDREIAASYESTR